MKKCLFVISEKDHEYLQILASKEEKTMSKLIREGIGHLKVVYDSAPSVYNDRNTSIYPAKKQEVV